MSKESLQGKFSVAWVNHAPACQAVIECRLSGAEGAIDKILTLTSDAVVSSLEPLSGELNYSGQIVLSMVYLTSEGEVNSVKSSFPFTSKTDSSLFEAGQKVQCAVKVIDAAVESVSSDSVRVICTVESLFTVFGEEEITSFDSDSSDYCAKTGAGEFMCLASSKEGTIEVSEQKATSDKIKKVLKVDANSILNSCQAGNGYVVLTGEVETCVLCMLEGDEGQLSTFNLNIPFKEEVEYDGAEKEMQFSATLDIRNDLLVATIMQDSDKMNISCALSYNIVGLKKCERNFVLDVYSLTNSLLLSTNSFSDVIINEPINFENKFEGSVYLDDDKPRIDKVLAFSGVNSSVTAVKANENEISADGIVKVNVIYLNDENSSVNSVEVELPFSIKDKMKEDLSISSFSAQCLATSVDVMVKKGRDIYVDGKIAVQATSTSTRQNAIISEVREGETYQDKKGVISIYYAQAGQSIWDIAKDAREREELIIMQNPNLPEIMLGGEKIVIYRQKT